MRSREREGTDLKATGQDWGDKGREPRGATHRKIDKRGNQREREMVTERTRGPRGTTHRQIGNERENRERQRESQGKLQTVREIDRQLEGLSTRQRERDGTSPVPGHAGRPVVSTELSSPRAAAPPVVQAWPPARAP